MTQSPDSLCIPVQTPREALIGIPKGCSPTSAPEPSHQLLLTQLELAVGVRDPEWVSAPAGELSAS